MIAAVDTALHRVAPPIGTVRRADEAARANNYPLARWYLRPLAFLLASKVVHTAVRPWHITLAGFFCAAAAMGLLLWEPALSPVSALLVLAWWLCDRTDGILARLQATATPLGAWLDGNLDELVDFGLHLAMAHTAASQGMRWAWPLLVAFFFGKYLLMHGLASSPRTSATLVTPETLPSAEPARRIDDYFRLPGNADVRTHLLVLALLSGWFTVELAFIAVYYNVRWIVRYPLLIARARRQAG